MLPAAVISFSAADTGTRHGEATINCDLSFVADANARCGKRKVSATVKQLCSNDYHHSTTTPHNYLCFIYNMLSIYINILYFTLGMKNLFTTMF